MVIEDKTVLKREMKMIRSNHDKENNNGLCSILLAVVAITALILPGVVFAQEGHQVGEMTLKAEDAERIFKKPGYSPYAGRNFPTRVYWGDTHLHTNLSMDARAFGVTLGVEEAYRFARGDEVTATHGERVKLSRPLDWLVIADHVPALNSGQVWRK
jgi:hypothetical protein